MSKFLKLEKIESEIQNSIESTEHEIKIVEKELNKINLKKKEVEKLKKNKQEILSMFLTIVVGVFLTLFLTIVTGVLCTLADGSLSAIVMESKILAIIFATAGSIAAFCTSISAVIETIKLIKKYNATKTDELKQLAKDNTILEKQKEPFISTKESLEEELAELKVNIKEIRKEKEISLREEFFEQREILKALGYEDLEGTRNIESKQEFIEQKENDSLTEFLTERVKYQDIHFESIVNLEQVHENSKKLIKSFGTMYKN